jgi:rhodanese-related sulfurtransferase
VLATLVPPALARFRRLHVNAPTGGVALAVMTVDELLARARSRLGRLEPRQAEAAARACALLIDIRSEAERARDGLVPGALFVPRNVLEWRCDPASPHRDPRIDGRARTLILVCDEGYQSSLAAATLHELGLTRTTDVIGGFRAWRDAGLPVCREA